MKLVLGFVLVISSMSALAWEADNTKALSDVSYIPAQGTFFGRTTMEWNSITGEIGLTSSEVDYSAGFTTFGQEIGYGISDRLQVLVGYENQLKGRIAVEANGNRDIEGPANPDLGFIYRVLKQEDDSINLDIGVSYSPDLFDSESNSTKNESDNASGGSSITLGGRGAKKFTNVDMTAEVRLRLNGSTETKDTVTKEKEKEDSTSDFLISYTAQLPIENGFFVKGKLTSIMSSESKSKDSSGTTKTETSSSTALEASLVYAILPETLVLEAGFGLLSASEYEVKTPTQTQKYRDQSGNRVFISALYQF